MLNNIISKPVPGYPSYRVDILGNIYSNYKGGGYKLMSSNRIKNNGYAIISLRNSQGVKKTFGIHQVVAMTWLPNPENKINPMYAIRITYVLITGWRTYIGVQLRRILYRVLRIKGFIGRNPS